MLASIAAIIAVEVLRSYSRYLAALTVVMPVNVTLALLLVASGEEDQQSALVEFSEAVVINIIPTLVFIGVVWWGARAGYDVLRVVGLGYAGWGVAVAVIFVLRRVIGG